MLTRKLVGKLIKTCFFFSASAADDVVGSMAVRGNDAAGTGEGVTYFLLARGTISLTYSGKIKQDRLITAFKSAVKGYSTSTIIVCTILGILSFM